MVTELCVAFLLEYNRIENIIGNKLETIQSVIQKASSYFMHMDLKNKIINVALKLF